MSLASRINTEWEGVSDPVLAQLVAAHVSGQPSGPNRQCKHGYAMTDPCPVSICCRDFRENPVYKNRGADVKHA